MMDPHLDIRFVVGSFTLGQFVFMMREDKILAAAMDIKGGTQIFTTHCRAFYMPARSAGPPWTVPTGLAGFGSLPQHKIHGIVFLFINRNTGTGLHIFKITPGELTVICK